MSAGGWGCWTIFLAQTQHQVKRDFPTVNGAPSGATAKHLKLVFVSLIRTLRGDDDESVRRARPRASGSKAGRGDWLLLPVRIRALASSQNRFAHLFEADFTTKGRRALAMGLFCPSGDQGPRGPLTLKTKKARALKLLPAAAFSEGAILWFSPSR